MSLKQQTLWIVENLRFTRSGVVWADFVLTGQPYGYRPADDKRSVRSLHKMLMRSLNREALLMGVCVDLDPLTVARKMTEGVDLDAHPEWEAECEASLDTLAEFRPGERIFWLSIPLAGGDWREKIAASWASTKVELVDRLGLIRPVPTERAIASARRRAAVIERDLPGMFDARPATAAQMMWLHQHALQRGLSIDRTFPVAGDGAGDERSAAGFSRARLDEGAQSDRRGRVPSLAKVLKVDQPWSSADIPASYQCFMALADSPSGGALFPGSEYFTLADDVPGADIDWAVRLYIRSSDEVRKKNQRALTQLNDQFRHREGEMSYTKGVLDVAADELAEYAAKMESDSLEVEVGSSTVFIAAGQSQEVALERARALSKLFEDSEYKLDQPLGFQEELWHACMPGVPTPKIVEEYRQITTSTDYSAAVPVTGTHLGDTAGALIALNISTARTGVVLHDIAAKSSGSDVAGSFGIGGDLGSGKGVLFKVLIGSFLDRGGRAVMVDHTEMGEYELFLRSVSKSVTASFSTPSWSLDPLRLFDPKRGCEIAMTILMPLLQIQPDDRLGVVLASVLDPNYLREHQLLGGGLPAVLDHLLSEHCPAARVASDAVDLADKMGVYARASFAGALFVRDLPPLDLTVPGICFRTNALRLPSQSEVEREHLFKQLSLEKRFGRAAYSLAGLIAREVCFRNPEPGLFALDECHRWLNSEDGMDVAIEFLKEGRKENAFLGLASQDAIEGMPSEALRGLMPTKFGMRQMSKDLARRELEFLDLDPTDALIKELTTQTSPVVGKDARGKEIVEPHRRGEGYMRDAYGRCGRIKVLLPSDPHRRAAVLTTPQASDDTAEIQREGTHADDAAMSGRDVGALR